MTKETKKQILFKKTQKSINLNKNRPSKKFINVRTGIRAGSVDSYGFTSCAIK